MNTPSPNLQVVKREQRSNSDSTHRDVHWPVTTQDDHALIDLRELWIVISLNRLLLVTCVVACVAIAFTYSVFVVEYKSSAVLAVVPTHENGPMNMFDRMRGEGDNSKTASQIGLFRSQEYSQALITAILQYPSTASFIFSGDAQDPKRLNNASEERLRHELFTHISLQPDESSGTLTLNAITHSARASANLANLAADVLTERNLVQLKQKVKVVKKFVLEQTEKLRNQLEELEGQLITVQKSSNFISEEDASRVAYDQYMQNGEAITKTESGIAEIKGTIQETSHEMSELSKMLKDPSLSRMQLFLKELERRSNYLQYQLSMEKSKPSNEQRPEERIGLENELKSVGQKYQSLLETLDGSKTLATITPLEYYKSLDGKLADLKKELEAKESALRSLNESHESLKEKLNELPQKIRALVDIKRKIKLTSDLYSQSNQKLQETQFLEAQSLNDLKIVIHAQEADAPLGAGKLRSLLIAIVLGLILGGGIIFLKEYLIHVVRRRRDLEALGFEVLAELPFIDGNNVQSVRPDHISILMKSQFADKTDKLVTLKNPDSRGSDLFRSARMRMVALLQKFTDWKTGRAPVIMITSAQSSAGKSYISANLASVFAKAEYKTLLIELDVRKPTLKSYFSGVNQGKGIEALLDMGPESIKGLIREAAPNLHVLLANSGAVHPPELLESEKLHQLVEDLRQTFDIIILDTPPALVTIDPCLVAAHSDLGIMVVESQKTFVEDVLAVQNQLNKIKALPIHTIINFSNRPIRKYVS